MRRRFAASIFLGVLACSDVRMTPPVDPGVSFVAAEDLLRKVTENPKDGVAQAQLAQLYLELGYGHAAIERIKQCMSIDRSQPDCVYALATLFELDGSQQAMREARRAFRLFVQVAPNHPKVALAKSKLDQLDSRLGPDTEAPPDFAASQPSLEGHGKSAPHGSGTPIPGHGGEGSEDVGELNEFGAAIQRAFQAVEKNDPVAAETAFRDALKLRPQDPTALAGLAQSQLAQGRADEALKSAEEAIKADAKDPQALWTLGLVLLRSGKDPQRGVQVWEQLVKEDLEYAKRLHVPEQLENIRKMINQQNVHPR